MSAAHDKENPCTRGPDAPTGSRLPYIEPTIRTIAGVLIVMAGGAIYFDLPHTALAFGVLFFVSINLAQSGFTDFCFMEKCLNFLGLRSEVSEIRQLNAQAQIQLDTLNLLHEVVIEIASSRDITWASAPLVKMLGAASYQELASTGPPSINAIVAPEDQPKIKELLDNLAADCHGIITTRFRVQHRGGKELWVEGKFGHVGVCGNAKIRGILRDVTEPHLQELRIAQMALHDALTGLPNRILLEDRTQQAMLIAARDKHKMALLFIDLDNFKQVNDVYGHKAGDDLLLEVSRALSKRLRRSDTVARWGGDEFVVLLPNVGGVEDVRTVAGELMVGLREHLAREHPNYPVTISVGAAVFPEDAATAEDLLMQADKALFFAKSQGRNNVQLYSQMATDPALGFTDVGFTSCFTTAVRMGRIDVHYQPIIDAVTHMPVGMEALARWHDEQYGRVSPAVFIPLAENLGLIEEVGRQVLEKAFDDYAQCRMGAINELFLSVNISSRQLESPDFAKELIAMAARSGVDPRRIKLEITEGIALLGLDRAAGYLDVLSSHGFRISLDDFGTGYSSFAYLDHLPIDEIKIDKSFVQRLDSGKGRALVKTIVDLSHALGMNVVAEGVESAESAQLLGELGVSMLQGYYFRAPGPREECLAYVAACRRCPHTCTRASLPAEFPGTSVTAVALGQ